MPQFWSGWRVPVIMVAGSAAILVWHGMARASVIEDTATLPLLNFPYMTSGGDCFPTAGFCIAGNSFTLTSVVSFNQTGPSNEDETIVTNAIDTIDLTTLSHAPAGSVLLTGSITQKVIDRLNPTFTGSWTVQLTAMNLSGMLNGLPLTLELNPSDLASDVGTTSIVQDGANYLATSFFDVFAEVNYNSLTAFPSGSASVGAPEPATLALLAAPVLALGAARRRRS
jgi:hypothetical protein